MKKAYFILFCLFFSSSTLPVLQSVGSNRQRTRGASNNSDCLTCFKKLKSFSREIFQLIIVDPLKEEV